jgi:hypothetical protein
LLNPNLAQHNTTQGRTIIYTEGTSILNIGQITTSENRGLEQQYFEANNLTIN